MRTCLRDGGTGSGLGNACQQRRTPAVRAGKSVLKPQSPAWLVASAKSDESFNTLVWIEKVMNCFKCGLELTGKARFCSDCGEQQPMTEPALAADPMAAGTSETAMPEPAVEPPPPAPDWSVELPNRRGKSGRSVAAAVIALALLGAAGYWFMSRNNHPADEGAVDAAHQAPASHESQGKAHPIPPAHGAAAAGHGADHGANQAADHTTDHASNHPPSDSQRKMTEILKKYSEEALVEVEKRYQARQAAKKLNPAPRFVEIPPDDGNIKVEFTVNLADKDKSHYFQTKIVLRTLDAQSEKNIVDMRPVLNSKIIIVLSGRTLAETSTNAGKFAIANDVALVANAALDPLMTLIYILQSNPSDETIASLVRIGAIPRRLDDGSKCCSAEMKEAARRFWPLTTADLPVESALFKSFVLQ